MSPYDENWMLDSFEIAAIEIRLNDPRTESLAPAMPVPRCLHGNPWNKCKDGCPPRRAVR